VEWTRVRPRLGKSYLVFEQSFDPMRMTFFHFLVFLFLLTSNVLAQEGPSISVGQMQQATHPDTVLAAPQVRLAQSPAIQEKHPRLFWIIPIYTVSDSKLPISLSSGEKFQLFLKDTTDPFTLTFTAFNAGIQQVNNGLSGYGQGAAGYGKRLGAGMADETSSDFLGTYLFPSLLHQDPRYLREGSGPFKSRLVHAIIRPMATRKDLGGRAFNWSGLLGLMAANGLSNIYYPATDRGIERTFKRVASGLPFSVIDHLIEEFGPDLQKKLLGRK
jgi:hypothetical protein